MSVCRVHPIIRAKEQKEYNNLVFCWWNRIFSNITTSSMSNNSMPTWGFLLWYNASASSYQGVTGDPVDYLVVSVDGENHRLGRTFIVRT
mmetsp:Transcript_18273/g.23698  ORF Transcript_18273/g.23698 Transcript_18273/m.23698 type:complete len:90 (+) Transcript_18273:261-530(+)